MLKHDSPAVVERAAALLRCLACPESSRTLARAIPAASLLQLLKRPSPDVVAEAAGVIAAIADTALARAQLVNAGAAPPLAAHLCSPHPRVATASLAACRALLSAPPPAQGADTKATSPGNTARVQMARAGALATLVQMVRGGAGADAAEPALEVLRLMCVCEGPTSKAQLAAAGAVPQLLPLLSFGAEWPAAAGLAAGALAALCAAPVVPPQVATSPGALKHVAALLRSGDAAAAPAAAALVQALAPAKAAHGALLASGALRAAVAALSAPEVGAGGTAAAAAAALEELSLQPPLHQPLADAGALQVRPGGLLGLRFSALLVA